MLTMSFLFRANFDGSGLPSTSWREGQRAAASFRAQVPRRRRLGHALRRGVQVFRGYQDDGLGRDETLHQKFAHRFGTYSLLGHYPQAF